MRDHAELPFSPTFDFVWMRPCTLNGVAVEAGDMVDKSQLDERRLRVLFQTRRIRPAGFEDGVKPNYLENGKGLANKLAAEIEAEAKQEGEGDVEADEPAPAIVKTSSAKRKRLAAARQSAKAKAAKPGPKAKSKPPPKRRAGSRVR